MALTFLLSLCLCLSPPAAQATVVDRIAAQVDDQIILESDIRLEDALTTLDPSSSPFWQAAHKSAAERLVDAAVIRLAAGDIDIYQPTDEEVVARRNEVRARVGAPSWASFLTTSAQTEQSLLTVIRRRLIVERYLGRNNQADIADTAAWLATCEQIVDGLRQRSRVRLIEIKGRP